MIKRMIVVLAVLAAIPVAAQAQSKDKYWDDRDLPERDEFRQTYQLASGSRVQLSGLNCGVKIETASGNTAEVHIVRSARTREDL